MPVLQHTEKMFEINEELFTIKKYKVNGKYTAERATKHEEITYLRISQTVSDENPSAALVGGGSGAGKSTIIKQYFAPELDKLQPTSDFVYIDSDDIKKEIEEFKEYCQSCDENTVYLAAFYVHGESTDIADMLIEECTNQKLSFIYDGTMQWKPQYDALIPKLKTNGYELTGVYIDVDVEKAIERVKTRGKKEKRHVPEDIVRRANLNSAINFSLLESEFDSVLMFNNTADLTEDEAKEPILPFYEREQPAKELFEGTILIEEFFNLFIEKSTMTYIE